MATEISELVRAYSQQEMLRNAPDFARAMIATENCVCALRRFRSKADEKYAVSASSTSLRFAPGSPELSSSSLRGTACTSSPPNSMQVVMRAVTESRSSPKLCPVGSVASMACGALSGATVNYRQECMDGREV